MSKEQLNELKSQLSLLTPEERVEIKEFLIGSGKDASQPPADPPSARSDLKHARHLAWLKTHREEYAGKYVALDDGLVGCGASIREAREQARGNGVENPFLVHVSSASDAPFGGW